ncbi:MAG: T9SS type A sorting domain-containing protein [Chitinispirillales bacterium]|jgi:hypothetical protein|nr:T9SS type A sorting domain-containing protein [Chitinispirillales bacterium]
MDTRKRTCFFLFWVLTIAPALLFAEVLLQVNFEDHPLGQYTREMAQADFHYPGYTWFSNSLELGRGEIVPGENGTGKALRLLYPAGQIGSASTVQIRAALKRGVDTAWASYRVMFGSEGVNEFDFVRGGKLPGLCGGECITGGREADGYNGWSARVMWRREGLGEQYLYYTANQGFGEELLFDKVPPTKRFIPGQWHSITTQVIMNTPGAADGMVRTWVDGELSLEQTGMVFRHTDELNIDLFYISTFFGGSDPSWAPPTDTYITFDDFLVVSNPESSPYPQTLYTLSETAGRLAPDGSGFTIYADLTASLGSGLNYETRGLAPTTPVQPLNATMPGAIQELTFYSPGIYNINFNVSDGTRDNPQSRHVIVLDQLDLLCDNVWQRMPLGRTFGTGDTLRFFLTILDPDAEIRIGPSARDNTGNPSGASDAHLYGVLRYENGKFSAKNGNSNSVDSFIDDPAAVPEKHGAGTYELVFTFDFGPPSQDRTYNVTVYSDQGVRLAGWENLLRRGFASNGEVAGYDTRANRDRAAVVHMEEWEAGHVVSVSPRQQQTQTARLAARPSVRPRQNGISFTMPTASQAQVEIFNARGILVRRMSTDGRTSLTIPVSAKGLYIYRIRSGGDVFRGSVIVR